MPSLTPRRTTVSNLIDKVIEIMLDKKAEDILVLNLKKLSPIAQYFVIATANSQTHARAISDALVEKLKKENNVLSHHIEGYKVAQWILLDYIDCVIHIFLKEVREFYGLERLWGDAPMKKIKVEEKPSI